MHSKISSNHIGGIMVTMLISSAVVVGSMSGQVRSDRSLSNWYMLIPH
jgi:hypothetical protein